MNRLFLLVIAILFPAIASSKTITFQDEFVSFIHEENIDIESKLEPKSDITKKNNTYFIVDPVFTRHYNFRTKSSDNSFGISDSPGLSFLSSLAIPGTGQLANKNWVRAGLYVAVEAAGIYFALNNRQKAIKGERNYENFADNNWSVVEYSNWLIEYHEVHNIDNPYIEQLKSELNGVDPTFNTEVDWGAVDISLLRNVERNTPYFTTDTNTGNNLSHSLPAYGSQQYYELIAKYYQYQAGWQDYNRFHDDLGHVNDNYIERFFIDRNGLYASTFFTDAADSARKFNNDYRRSSTFVTLLIVNHVISAFDAYFTVKVKQNRLQASSNITPGRQFVLTYQF